MHVYFRKGGEILTEINSGGSKCHQCHNLHVHHQITSPLFASLRV